MRKNMGQEHPWNIEYNNQPGFISTVKSAASNIKRRLVNTPVVNAPETQRKLEHEGQPHDKNPDDVYKNILKQ